MTRAQVWSYGGGTQSVAIAVLLKRGLLPVPECVVIADTGREMSATWQYTEEVVAPLLARLGVTVERASHDLATVDLYGLNGDLLIPAYTTREGGRAPGQLRTLCSTEWKKRVVARYLRGKGYGPSRPVDTWIGISVDEVHRAKDSGVEWYHHRYPLLFDHPLRRAECISLVESEGLPTPPRSSCWMCPFKSNAEWRHLRDTAPEDWSRALAFDAEIRGRDGHAFIHRSGTPLAAADLGDAAHQAQGDLWECASGYCFV